MKKLLKLLEKKKRIILLVSDNGIISEIIRKEETN